MDGYRKTFATFLSLHEPHAPTSDDPCVYIGMTPTNVRAPLVRMTRDDVLAACDDGEFDRGAELVRWMFTQLSTYDPTHQRILALRFDKSVILSEVLRCR